MKCPRCQHENPTDATFCDGDVSPRQARLIFSPPRVVDLGPVPNSGSGARYLAIHGKRHLAKCPSKSNGSWVCVNEFLARTPPSGCRASTSGAAAGRADP